MEDREQLMLDIIHSQGASLSKAIRMIASAHRGTYDITDIIDLRNRQDIINGKLKELNKDITNNKGN